MATPQGAQPPPPPTAYDRDDHLIGVLAGALRAQTDAEARGLDALLAALTTLGAVRLPCERCDGTGVVTLRLAAVGGYVLEPPDGPRR